MYGARDGVSCRVLLLVDFMVGMSLCGFALSLAGFAHIVSGSDGMVFCA